MDWINKTWINETWINKTWINKTWIGKTWRDITRIYEKGLIFLGFIGSEYVKLD